MTATSTSQGVLELHPKGFGFLRDPARHYAPRPSDPYVPQPLIRKHELKQGLLVAGPVEPASRGSTGPRLADLNVSNAAAICLYELARRRN